MGLKENTMSYYSDVAFVVAFDDKDKLTAWLCAAMLEIQQDLEWYADNQESAGFNKAAGLIDVLKCGGYRKYNLPSPILDHAFVVHHTFDKLPWATDQGLSRLADLAENMGGGGGYIIVGEDIDDVIVLATKSEMFDMGDYFSMHRVITEADETYDNDDGKLLAQVLGA
jgi:hypothetical protein